MPPIIQVKNLSCRFPKLLALNDLSLSINSGECLLVAGECGAGKTLLMNIIAGLEEPTSGIVKANTKDIYYIFQEPTAQILGATIEEDLIFSLKCNGFDKGFSKDKVSKRIEEVLKILGLYEKRAFNTLFLSGGEKRLLSIANALLLNRSILILDEPFCNLDYKGTLMVTKALLNLKNEGRTLIILTHEVEKALPIVERALVLKEGVIAFDGEIASLLKLNLADYGIAPIKSIKS